MSFVNRQLEMLINDSGWVRNPVLARMISDAGLPPINEQTLRHGFGRRRWFAAEEALGELFRLFSAGRFSVDVGYGLLLVPDPKLLDTRSAMPAEVRSYIFDSPSDDVVDERLTAGRIVTGDDPWTMVIGVHGQYGPGTGSYNDVIAAPAEEFTVLGQDTREAMTRQLWGTRVLQANNRRLPDAEGNERWTFTLFPGEGLTDGQAESGTILKGKVRFRLGKPDRGIASARVAPAVIIE